MKAEPEYGNTSEVSDPETGARLTGVWRARVMAILTTLGMGGVLAPMTGPTADFIIAGALAIGGAVIAWLPRELAIRLPFDLARGSNGAMAALGFRARVKWPNDAKTADHAHYRREYEKLVTLPEWVREGANGRSDAFYFAEIVDGLRQYGDKPMMAEPPAWAGPLWVVAATLGLISTPAALMRPPPEVVERTVEVERVVVQADVAAQERAIAAEAEAATAAARIAQLESRLRVRPRPAPQSAPVVAAPVEPVAVAEPPPPPKPQPIPQDEE